MTANASFHPTQATCAEQGRLPVISYVCNSYNNALLIHGLTSSLYFQSLIPIADRMGMGYVSNDYLFSQFLHWLHRNVPLFMSIKIPHPTPPENSCHDFLDLFM